MQILGRVCGTFSPSSVEIQQVSWSRKVARTNKGFCFVLDLDIAVSLAPLMPSGLAS